ncbi:MAG: hypothetical protein M1838_004265 [Thelocarpon superellum]|nr:MAG: hypothetical protein M1838_004265 [Thelocarpon superellum]
MTKRPRKPATLPLQQLTILAICRFAEPVVLTSVFPYLPEMMEFVGVPTDRVAYFAGLTSAVFSLSQGVTGIAWGRASDTFGRKPAILAGLFCSMTTSLLFGFSRSLTWAMLSRTLAGLGNGSVGILRTTVAEMVPERELQPRAFSIMPLVWTMGSILGPSFGGFLANPARRHPDWFGPRLRAFFEEFPFILPNLVASVFFLVGLVVGTLFLRESLATRKDRPDYGVMLGRKLVKLFTRSRKASSKHDVGERDRLLGPSPSSSTPTLSSVPDAEDSRTTVAPAKHTFRDVFTPQSTIALGAYSMVALHSLSFDQLLPIFMHHPRQKHDANPNVQLPLKFGGGFGIDSGRIGLLFTLYGVLGMLIQFLIFPSVARRVGILNCFKACAITFPIVYFLTPFTALVEPPVWQQGVMFLLMSVKCVAAVFVFPCAIILMTNSATSLQILGTLNGVATSVSAVGRAGGPAMSGAAFTLGVRWGYVILPWWTLSALAMLGAIPVWFVEERDGFGDGTDGDDEEEGSENEDVAATINPAYLRGSREGEGEEDAATDQATAKRVASPIGIRSRPAAWCSGRGARSLGSTMGHSHHDYGTGGMSLH